VEIGGASEDLLNNSHEYEWMILEELNIKTIKWNKNAEFSVLIDTKVTPELKIEGIARDLVRAVQNARKNNGLNVEDRIVLRISTENELIQKAVNSFKDIIETETLASYIDDSLDSENGIEEKIDGSMVKISLRKA
jgi:isoleucyl-tRNA synthetase